MNVREVVVLFLLAFILAPASVHAYLDPGTGSIVYQVAVGSLLALVAAVRLYWKKIASLFRRSPAKSGKIED